MTAPSRIGQGQGPLAELSIPGGWTERTELVGNHAFNLLLPANPVEFLNQLDESSPPHLEDPYWSAVWSASPALADRVLRGSWPAGLSVLELGCGVGLAGLAALAAGGTVTFSDYVDTAVTLALENARRNGFTNVNGLLLDWREPPSLPPFPLVLASDVLYETRLHAPLLMTLDRVLHNDGQCWIGDPQRAAATDFANLARQRGYLVTVDEGDTAASPTTDRANFQLLILRRRPA